MSADPTRLTVGADIEFFAQRKGILYPMAGKIGAKKKSPMVIHPHNNTAVQEDGLTVEMTFDPQSPQEFHQAARESLELLRAWLLTNHKADIIRSDTQNVQGIVYPPEADVIGCDPDFEAYTFPVQPREPLNVSMFQGARFASGHIHLGTAGLPIGGKVPPYIQAQLADFFIGCSLHFGCCSKQGLRRAFYGLPGLYRPKPYGFEYRTPPNLWVFSQRNMTDSLFDFESLFWLEIDQLKALYKKIPWPQIREWLGSPSTGENYGAWIALGKTLGYNFHGV